MIGLPLGVVAASYGRSWLMVASEDSHRQLYPNNPSTTIRIGKYQLIALFL
jgi:hypothetical protein